MVPEQESAANKAAADEGSIVSKHSSKTNLSKKELDAAHTLGVFSLQFVRASSSKHAKQPGRLTDSSGKAQAKKIVDIDYTIRCTFVPSTDQAVSTGMLSNSTVCPLLTFTPRGNLRTGLPPSAITIS